MLYYDIYRYKDWQFLILVSDQGLRSLSLYDESSLNHYIKDSARTKPYTDAVDRYFKGQPFNPNIALDLNGTPFEKRVWQALMNVPYGQTKSYKKIAELIHNPGASQAVGNAVGKNPIMLVIPCHRIIKANGTIGGFSSDINLKIELLNIERG